MLLFSNFTTLSNFLSCFSIHCCYPSQETDCDWISSSVRVQPCHRLLLTSLWWIALSSAQALIQSAWFGDWELNNMLQSIITQGYWSRGEGAGFFSRGYQYEKHRNWNISYCFDLITLENVVIFLKIFQYFFTFSGLQVEVSFNEIWIICSSN